MQIDFFEENCMKMSKPIFWKNKKNIIDLSSADSALRVMIVKLPFRIVAGGILLIFYFILEYTS